MKSFSVQTIIPPVACSGVAVVSYYAYMMNYQKCSFLLAMSTPPATGDIIVYQATTAGGANAQQLNISNYRVIDGVSQSATWSDATCSNNISIWPGIGSKVFLWVDISAADMSKGYRYLKIDTVLDSGTIAAVAILYDPISYTLDNIGAIV